GSGDAPMVRDTSSYWNPVRVPTLPRYTAIDRIPLSRIHSYNATGAAAVDALLDLQSRHLPTAQSLGVRTQQRPVARHLADDPYEAWHALDRLKTAESSPVIAVTLVRLDLDARTVGNAWTIGPNDPMPSGFIGNGKFYAFVLRQNSRPIDRAAVLGPEDSQGSRIDDSEDDRVDLPVAPTRPVELRDLLEQAPNGRDAIRALRAIENANGWPPTVLTTTLDEFSGNAREVWQRLRNLQASAVPFVAVTVVRLGNNPNESGAWTITPDRIDNDRQPRGFQGPGRFHGFVLGADGARVAHDVVMDPPAPPAATEQAAPADGGLPAPEATAAEQAQAQATAPVEQQVHEPVGDQHPQQTERGIEQQAQETPPAGQASTEPGPTDALSNLLTRYRGIAGFDRVLESNVEFLGANTEQFLAQAPPQVFHGEMGFNELGL